ncbi:MAG: SDR family NAD(P)-dependent oxidoreductase [Pseudomonadota bacterium]
MPLLTDKVCLVTGGASNPGLGHSIAHKYGSEGASVIITDTDEAGAAKTAEEINAAGGQAVSWRQDVTSDAEWDSTMTRIREDFGRIDTLVNNAGIVIVNPIEEFTLDDYNKQMIVNMTSVFLGTQRAVMLMRETGTRGSIINMSSIVALVGVYAVSAYAASKGGVLGFTKSIAAETAREGIRCNTIHPGMIATNMNIQAKDENPEEYKALNESIPMGYMGEPSTIADAALFLASDLSSYVTGTQIVVDGGLINQ